MTFIQFDTAFEDEVFPFASHRAGNRLGVVIDHLFALGGITAQASVAHSAFGLVDRLNRSQVHRQVGVVIRIQGLAGLVVFPVLLDVSLAGITDHGAVLSGEHVLKIFISSLLNFTRCVTLSKSVEMAMCIMIFSPIDSVMRLLQPANTAQEAAAANKVNFFIVGSLN